MRLFFVAAAAIAAAVPAVAEAQRLGGSGFRNAIVGSGAHSRDRMRDNSDFERPRDRDDHRDRHRRGNVYLYSSYGDRDIDRSWQFDSFNDWWHERPHRSHPAWMSRNESCERKYWSGGGWRC